MSKVDDAYASVAEFSSVVAFVWRYKLILVSAALGGAVLAYGLSYLAPPWFQATTVVMPSPALDQGSPSGGLGAGLEGIASLAGITTGGSSKEKEAIATLQSRQLAREFIVANTLIDVFDNKASEDGATPQLARAERRFNEDSLTISEDRKSGLLRVSVSWTDPDKAQEWANSFVRLANERFSERAIDQAEASIKYLTLEADKAANAALRQLLFALIQSDVQTIAMARARPYYAFVTIDPAFMPDGDDIIKPRRAVLAALGFIGGGFLGVFICLWRVRRSG